MFMDCNCYDKCYICGTRLTCCHSYDYNQIDGGKEDICEKCEKIVEIAKEQKKYLKNNK